MSFSRHSSPPKRTSIANVMNGRPAASTAGAACVMRTRRSRGGKRAREKRLVFASCSASGARGPSRTRFSQCCAGVGSAAVANDGTSESTSANEETKTRRFTEDLSDGFEDGEDRGELDDRRAQEDGRPEGVDVCAIGI